MSTETTVPQPLEPILPVDCPPILLHKNFLEYVRQALNGFFIAAIQQVKKTTRQPAGKALRGFVQSKAREEAENLVIHFLKRYTQSICDDYCTSYGAIFDEHRIDLNTALNSGFDMDRYAFYTLNRIFEESRRAANIIPQIEMKEDNKYDNINTNGGGNEAAASAASTPSTTLAPPVPPHVSLPGPLHLGCFTKCFAFEFAPTLIPLILQSLEDEDISMGSSSNDNSPTLSEAAKNIVRFILDQHISQAFQKMRTVPELLEAAREMKFVCQPPPTSDFDSHSPCDEGWDWQVIDESKRVEVRRLEKQMWQQYREDVKCGKIKIPSKQEEEEEESSNDEDGVDEDEDGAPHEPRDEVSSESESEGEEQSPSLPEKDGTVPAT